MPHLTCMRGLPASGKTTRARAIAADSGAVVVGRDFLRHMLFDDYVPGQPSEESVTVAETGSVIALLKAGYDVIIDNTHLQPRYLRAWAKVAGQTGATFSIRDCHASVEECIARDALRERNVGEAVIRRMAKRAQYPTITAPDPIEPQPVVWVDGLPDAILVDIDGTLTTGPHNRSPYDYTQVFNDLCDDTIRELVAVWEMGQFYETGRRPHIILCSGRDSSCRADTKLWLSANGINYDHLFMRPDNAVDARGNKLPDWRVKLELFNRFIRGNYNVHFVLDDRAQVVDMWRNVLGLKCLQVEPGDF